jgi:hypothetical protein
MGMHVTLAWHKPGMSLWCTRAENPEPTLASVCSVRIVCGKRACIRSTHLRAGTQPVRATVVVVNTNVPNKVASFRGGVVTAWNCTHSAVLAQA